MLTLYLLQKICTIKPLIHIEKNAEFMFEIVSATAKNNNCGQLEQKTEQLCVQLFFSNQQMNAKGRLWDVELYR